MKNNTELNLLRKLGYDVILYRKVHIKEGFIWSEIVSCIRPLATDVGISIFPELKIAFFPLWFPIEKIPEYLENAFNSHVPRFTKNQIDINKNESQFLNIKNRKAKSFFLLLPSRSKLKQLIDSMQIKQTYPQL